MGSSEMGRRVGLRGTDMRALGNKSRGLVITHTVWLTVRLHDVAL
jgi:hypothetical protein